MQHWKMDGTLVQVSAGQLVGMFIEATLSTVAREIGVKGTNLKMDIGVWVMEGTIGAEQETPVSY